MLTRLTFGAACLALLCGSCFGQGTISHIVVIIKENRSFDHMFGACAASAGGPIVNLTGFSSSSPCGACNAALSTCPKTQTACPAGMVSLLHANPALPDGYNSDLAHGRQAIVDSLDLVGGNYHMDGFGGICSVIPRWGVATQCWWRNRCSNLGSCTLAGSQGAAGGYTYFGCSDLWFYDQMIQKYGIADHYFPYATPSYPDHLQMIAPGTCQNGQNCPSPGTYGLGEAVDNPYTPGYQSNPGQWTCDALPVPGVGDQPSCSGTSCTGGYEYSSQVLSINSSTTNPERILGTPIAPGHYYQGGTLQCNQTACVCDEGSLLSSQLPNTGPPPVVGPGGTGSYCQVQCGGSSTCSDGCTETPGFDYCVVATPPASTRGSWGGNSGGVCPNITTVLDLADTHSPAVTWRWYGPTLQEQGYYWNSPAYIEHIRYGNDWTNNVFPWTQFDKDVASGSLPQVSWLVPPLEFSDHPWPGNNIAQGMNWTAARVQKIFQSPLYQSTVIFVVWDDPGGFYDHVPVPPPADAVGYGPRVPLICIGPYCKTGVSSTVFEPASIVRCIEDTFGLPHNLGKDGNPNLISACANDQSSSNSGMIYLGQPSITPPVLRVIAPKATLFALSRPVHPDTDVLTLVRHAWQRLHPPDRVEADEIALVPQLNRERCFGGTHLHRALYVTSKGKTLIEICASDDGRQIYWPGQNPMDADDADEPRSRNR